MRTIEERGIRLTLAIVWLVTGLLSFGIYPQQESLALLSRVGLHGTPALAALCFGATADITLGVLTMFTPNKKLWVIQALLVATYTLIISFWLPEFWLHPFGPILKNLPILMLLWLLYHHEGKP